MADQKTTEPTPTKAEDPHQAPAAKSVPTAPPSPPQSGTSKTRKASTGKSAASARTETEPPLINPAWATYVIKKYDLVGQTAERAASALSSAIEKQVNKATKPEKLEKLVLAAIAESYRKARG